MTPGTPPSETGEFRLQPVVPPAVAEAPMPDRERSQDWWKRWRPAPKWLYGLAGVGGLLLVAWLLRPAPTPVEVVTVERGDLQVTVAAEGKTRVRDRFVVAAPVDGRLGRIQLSAGDRVEANGVVAQIDPLPLTSEVQQAQARLQELQAQLAGVETLRPKAAALAQAEARMQAAQAAQQLAAARLGQAQATWQQAQRELQRANTLLARGAIARQDQEAAALAETTRRQEWEAAQQAEAAAIAEVQAAQDGVAMLRAEQQDPDYLLDVYRAEMAGARAELARLADQAQRTEIRSPVSGQVLRVPEASARYVTAGTPLLEIGDPGQLELVIDVLSTDAVKIRPGDAIQVDQWGGDRPLAARVRSIEPSAFTKVSALGVEEQRVNVIGDFTAGDVPLGDGYRVDTEIVVDRYSQVLKVPISAVFPCDAGDCVFTVEAQRARLRSLQVGPRNAFEGVVEQGLRAGEQVIAYPETIEAGDRVVSRAH